MFDRKGDGTADYSDDIIPCIFGVKASFHKLALHFSDVDRTAGGIEKQIWSESIRSRFLIEYGHYRRGIQHGTIFHGQPHADDRQ